MGYAPAKGYTDKVYIYLHSYCKTLSALFVAGGDCGGGLSGVKLHGSLQPNL